MTSKVSGKIKAILTEEGSKVEKGDTVIIIDDEVYSIQYEQSKAGEKFALAQLLLVMKEARPEEIDQAEALFSKTEADYCLVRSNYVQIVKFHQSQSISDKALDKI